MRWTVLLFAFFSLPLYSQKPNIPTLPEGYFSLPIRHTPRLTGNFGELRDNHFHAGLDFKSAKGIPGDDILAVADGFIQRIKIDRGGYGQTLYIQHPCGLTSVYAHLSALSPSTQRYIDSIQQIEKNFEVTTYLDSTAIMVKKGEVIGQMGNTGHSYGPHLHFEIRDTETDIPINPLYYQFDIDDDKKPEIRQAFVYTLDQRFNELERKEIPLVRIGGIWTTRDTVDINGWRCGIGLDVIDKQNGSSNKNGIYEISGFLEDSCIFQFQASHCSFEETRQMNAHIDYARRQTHKQFVHRAHKLPNNTLSMYTNDGNGIVSLYSGRVSTIRIEVRDLHGNTEVLSLPLRQASHLHPQNSEEIFHAWLKYDKANYYNGQYVSVYTPEDALFEDLPLVIHPTAFDSGVLNSLRVGQPEVPIKKDIYVTLDQALLPKVAKEKICLIYVEHRSGKERSVGGQATPTGMKFRLPYLGLHELRTDTVGPYIEFRNKKSNWSKGQVLKWHISDNYEVIGEAKEVKITCHINGQFFPGYYDLKNHNYLLKIDEKWPEGDIKIELKVTDDRGNISIWTKNLFITKSS